MIIDWIILGVAGLALIGLIIVIVRKFPHVASLDLKSLPTHVQKEIKTALMEERLERKIKEVGKKFLGRTNTLQKRISEQFEKLQKKVKEWEEKYKEAHKPLTAEEREKNRQKVAQLIDEGNVFLKDENFAEAERKFIEVISIDHKNIPAYTGLTEVYTHQKNWQNAEETLLFLLKMNPKDDVLHLEIAVVLQERDKMKEAMDHVKKAVSLNPKNPKNLTALIEASLTYGEKFTAKNTLKKLKETNPDNQKIPEWDKKIADMGK